VDPNFYRFRSVWSLDAPVTDVYASLELLDDYPLWWPEIRAARRRDEHAYELTARSMLPYDLEFLTTQRRRDPEAGVLEADLTGDLEGFSRWTITGTGHATTAVFDEEVTANKALLRRLAHVARPAFRANHGLMMRDGRRGLATYLAGWRRGRESR
jgi:hypothetical protein